VIVYLPDNELPQEGAEWDLYVQACRHADLLIHDAQYTAEELVLYRGWGHSSYVQATRLALAAGVKRLALFHHDPKRTDEGLDTFAQACSHIAMLEKSPLEVFAAAEGWSEII
jgi:ribonuclease BN (tRNA processing enzyme)